jgi:hypothetical protein
LEGESEPVRFSIEERTFVLRKYKAERFNEINDMVGISKNLEFLQKKQLEAYYTLMDEVFSGDSEREGYVRTAELNPDSHRLMRMMDVDGAFRSFIDRAAPETERFLRTMLALSNRDTSVSIGYEQTDVSPASQNDRRMDY